MESLNQVCVTAGTQVTAIVGYAIYLAGMNFVPSPDKVSNPVLKLISKIAHFLAVDVTTAVKK